MWAGTSHTVSARTLPYYVVGAALIAAVWLVAIQAIESDRESEEAQSADKAMSLAKFFDDHVVQIIRHGDTYIKAVRREYVGDGIAAVRRLTEEVPVSQSEVSHVTIIDKHGSPLFVSGHTLKPGTTASDRPYFLHQMTAQRDEIYVSLPSVGRTSGKLIIRLVRRITLPDGEFGGVVFAAIEVEQFTRFFDHLSLGAQSTATLVGLDKRIRARSSYGKLGPGQDISGSRIWRELESSPTGLYQQTSVVDGVSRYYAYRKLPDFPLVVAIGVSMDDISQAAARFKLPTIAIAVLATIVILILTVLVCRELSSRRRLQSNEARLDSIIDNVPAGIYLKDLQGRYIRVNRQFENWFGVNDGQVRNKTPGQVFPTMDAKISMKHDKLVRETGRLIEYEYEVEAEGDRLTLLSCKFPIRDGRAKIIGTGAIISNITETKRTETALRRAIDEAVTANKSKSEFLARMSHDFRTPLNAIIGFSEAMEGRLLGQFDQARHTEYARDIRDSGYHLLALVNDLLDLSKIEAGQFDLSDDVFALSDVAAEAVHLFEADLANKRIEAVLEIDDSLPDIRADRRAMSQMLHNLLSNAVKFTPDGGRIAIRASSRRDAVALQIEDNGVGIAREDLRQVLKPFGKTQRPLRDEGHGSGLGLYIVKSLIELHGGSIDIDSRPGGGTTVTLLFGLDRSVLKAA